MNYSNAELNVITYLDMGLSNQEIADRLFVCEKTVKFHLTNIYKKAEVHSRAEFMAKKNGHNANMRGEIMSLDKSIPPGARPLEQGARQVQVVSKTQEDKITFIDERFKVGETITQLHHMMKEVTKDEINPSSVNAACNCVARLNETINTAIQAAKFLNER